MGAGRTGSADVRRIRVRTAAVRHPALRPCSAGIHAAPARLMSNAAVPGPTIATGTGVDQRKQGCRSPWPMARPARRNASRSGPSPGWRGLMGRGATIACSLMSDSGRAHSPWLWALTHDRVVASISLDAAMAPASAQGAVRDVDRCVRIRRPTRLCGGTEQATAEDEAHADAIGTAGSPPDCRDSARARVPASRWQSCCSHSRSTRGTPKRFSRISANGMCVCGVIGDQSISRPPSVDIPCTAIVMRRHGTWAISAPRSTPSSALIRSVSSPYGRSWWYVDGNDAR